jgi:hypothetical protein
MASTRLFSFTNSPSWSSPLPSSFMFMGLQALDSSLILSTHTIFNVHWMHSRLSFLLCSTSFRIQCYTWHLATCQPNLSGHLSGKAYYNSYCQCHYAPVQVVLSTTVDLPCCYITRCGDCRPG